MNWCKKLLPWFACLLFISVSANAQQVSKQDPYNMINVVSQNLFDRLKQEQAEIKASPNQLKGVVEQELMPYVNHSYAALKVLGTNLKGADKQEVRDFIEAFKGYLITSYAQVLTLYSDQQVEFEPRKTIDSNSRIVGIKVDVLDPPRPNIGIEFKLRKNKKTGDWLAFDMVAEGISLLSSKQSEWGGKIRTDGIPAVTQELTRLADADIRFEGAASE